MQEDGTFDLLPKKEVIKLNLEIEKLEKFMGGIKDMTSMPGALFIVDPRKERIAVAEAKKLTFRLLLLLIQTVTLMKLITLSQVTMTLSVQ